MVCSSVLHGFNPSPDRFTLQNPRPCDPQSCGGNTDGAVGLCSVFPCAGMGPGGGQWDTAAAVPRGGLVLTGSAGEERRGMFG